MKKLFLLACILNLMTSIKYEETEVYVCGSAGAKKYHFTKKCRGLNSCKDEIHKKTLNEAKTLGLKLCAWED
jgi:hypothetical protein